MSRRMPIALLLAFTLPCFAGDLPAVATHWDWCGWGGGGYFWAAAYHPTRAGVIYLGGDVAGCYKSEDDGRHWRMINDGLIDYAVYGLAVDPSSPDTVYAISEAGTCKSTDAGEHWTNLAETNKGKLGIVPERHVSVRPLAVDPSDSKVVYAATPRGMIYKSEDGAATWREVFKASAPDGGGAAGGKAAAFASVSVSKKDPRLVLAASPQAGLFASRDAGKTWEPPAGASKSARYAVADPKDASILYGAFGDQGVYKSIDGGKTWAALNEGIKAGVSIVDVAVSPADSNQITCIGSIQWNGYASWSDNGGAKWNQITKLKADLAANPTVGMPNLSAPTNVTYCPTDARKLYVSSNWRPVFSDDGGRSWQERDRGADISCVYDVRFSKGRAYAACMDEGVLMSEDDGATWRQLWPRGGAGADKIAGHYWRIALSDNGGGGDRIVSTCSPWNANLPNRIVLSEDGGKTFKFTDSGLPTYRPHANTMWGQSYARALAIDPANPATLYVGLDGDPEGAGKPGGGIFKSTDGGMSWAMLEHQPDARRVFFGVAVDPTDHNRIYWGACGNGGGLYRTDDAGNSWQHVFKNEQWIFNILVTRDGTVYAPGKNLWRSTDHGKTWKKLTSLADGQIMGLEVDPRDGKTVWLSTVKHGGTVWGHILKTTDGGATWQDITGDIGFRKPAVLRFNPQTNELWAGGVGLFKGKQ